MVEKSVFSNVRDMPLVLEIAAMVGVVAPIITALYVYDDDAFRKYLGSEHTGKVLTDVDRIVVILLALPLFFSAIGMLMKKGSSRLCFFTGWALLSLSPLISSEIRNNATIMFYSELLFNIVCGILLLALFYLNKDVRKYFDQIESGQGFVLNR